MAESTRLLVPAIPSSPSKSQKPDLERLVKTAMPSLSTAPRNQLRAFYLAHKEPADGHCINVGRPRNPKSRNCEPTMASH